MPNAEKIQKVAALKERIQGSEALLLAEFRGLSVHDATELRRSLSGQARFSIVKNTLLQRAAADAGAAELQVLLEGPTAVAFVEDDVVATAKKVVEAAKRFPALVLKGGYLDGKVLSAAEAQALATLESREVTLSKIAGMLKAEMSRAASMFEAIQGRFLGVLDAYRDKLPAPEAEAPVEAEAPAEAEASMETEAPAEAEAPTEESAAETPPEEPVEVPTAEPPADEPAAPASGDEQTPEADASANKEEE